MSANQQDSMKKLAKELSLLSFELHSGHLLYLCLSDMKTSNPFLIFAEEH